MKRSLDFASTELAGIRPRAASSGLVGSCWSLRTHDGAVLSPIICLLANGILGGHLHAVQRRWALRGETLVFLDSDGVVTTIFNCVEERDGEIYVWGGSLRNTPQARLSLHRTVMPCLSTDHAHLDRTAPFLEVLHEPSREFLVVVCANAQSKHHEWHRDIDGTDRSWDLCVTRYDSSDVTPPPYEYLAYQRGEPKFSALYNLFAPNSPLWNYKFVWFPDDDLMTSWRAINRLFEVCDRHGLQLAQPSLVANGHVNHHITQSDPRYALRFTRFVEIMCPVFSMDALAVCLPTFRGTKSAYGLDHIWPRLLGSIDTRTAIIDCISVTHTRPMGTNYDIQTAIAEGLRMQELYAAPATYAAAGCIIQSASDVV